jgi:hypothetical protein
MHNSAFKVSAWLAVVGGVLVAAPACHKDDSGASLPAQVNFTQAGLYPESGSFTTGAVYPVTLAQRNGRGSYVLYSCLNALQQIQNPPVA